MNHQHVWRRLLCALALWSLIACACARTWWPEEHCSVDGGWSQCPPPDGMQAGIDVVDTLDAAAFLAHYHLKRPVLIRGAANTWAAKELWTRESLCARFGNATVKAGTSAQIVEHLGNGAATLSLCDFARYASQGDPAVAAGDEPQYVFDRGDFVNAHPHGIGDAFDAPAFWVAAMTAADASAPLVSYFLLGGTRDAAPLCRPC